VTKIFQYASSSLHVVRGGRCLYTVTQHQPTGFHWLSD